MKYKYTVRDGSSYKTGKILYRTNNKQAAYRFGWKLVKTLNMFPNIWEGNRWRATLVCHESQVAA